MFFLTNCLHLCIHGVIVIGTILPYISKYCLTNVFIDCIYSLSFRDKNVTLDKTQWIRKNRNIFLYAENSFKTYR